MIQEETVLNVADNTGAKRVRCIRVLGGSKKPFAEIGDIITIVVREAVPSGTVKKKEVVRGVIVRQRKELGRKDGTYIRFSENAVVIIDDKGEPLGTRIFGPVARELRARGYSKIISLAPEVL